LNTDVSTQNFFEPKIKSEKPSLKDDNIMIKNKAKDKEKEKSCKRFMQIYNL